MKWLILCLLALVIVSCGHPKIKSRLTALPSNKHDQIRVKAELYLELSKAAQDQDGFIDWEHCDSLLFSGLYGTAADVRLEAARDEAGAWHRRSLAQPECFPAGSASSISRDMFLGLLWWIWEHKRLDLAEDLFQYGQAHDWNMGEGDVARTYFTPALQGTLAEMIYRLGGKNRSAYRSIPQVYSKNVNFAAHLDVLLALLRAEMMGSMEKGALEQVAYNYHRVPQNALFAYAFHRYGDGDQTEAAESLLREDWFPADRLPTNHDRSESWMWQRDGGADWAPDVADKPTVTFSGGDFLFVASLILRS